jgi:hypothetical protein
VIGVLSHDPDDDVSSLSPGKALFIREITLAAERNFAGIGDHGANAMLNNSNNREYDSLGHKFVRSFDPYFSSFLI